MENINLYLIESFQVYEKNKDFLTHRKKLVELSKYKIHNMIHMGGISIPNVGPDEKIKDFYKELEGWSEEDIMEVKYLIKLYSGEDIENIQEAVIIMDVLINSDPKYKEVLNPIKRCLIENNEISDDVLVNLLKHKNMLLNNLFTFFTN